jgi:hypothetical protein
MTADETRVVRPEESGDRRGPLTRWLEGVRGGEIAGGPL